MAFFASDLGESPLNEPPKCLSESSSSYQLNPGAPFKKKSKQMDTPKKCSHKVEKGKCFLFQNHKIFLKGSMVGVSDQPFLGTWSGFLKV